MTTFLSSLELKNESETFWTIGTKRHPKHRVNNKSQTDKKDLFIRLFPSIQ